MPWGPADWDVWLPETDAVGHPALEPGEALKELLLRVPHRRSKVAGVLGGGSGLRTFLSVHFAEVVSVDAAGPQACHVVVVADLDSRAQEGIDELLGRAHACLVEGGLLLAAWPAVSPGTEPFAMRLGGSERPTPQLHEVELQYHLRRAGLQGIRVRRLSGDLVGREMLLSMSVKRANN